MKMRHIFKDKMIKALKESQENKNIHLEENNKSLNPSKNKRTVEGNE